jgi:hypothetical protein
MAKFLNYVVEAHLRVKIISTVDRNLSIPMLLDAAATVALYGTTM